MKEFLAKRKVHLFFGGIFLIVMVLNITIAFMAGQTFLGATWKAIGEIRPMDYLMFALFWYMCAVHRPKDDWHSSCISLNLSRSDSRK
jgi:uncharacterized membrane protein YbhN (UPF0104 family)